MGLPPTAGMKTENKTTKLKEDVDSSVAAVLYTTEVGKCDRPICWLPQVDFASPLFFLFNTHTHRERERDSETHCAVTVCCCNPFFFFPAHNWTWTTSSTYFFPICWSPCVYRRWNKLFLSPSVSFVLARSPLRMLRMTWPPSEFDPASSPKEGWCHYIFMRLNIKKDI